MISFICSAVLSLNCKIERALVSVSDKTGLEDLARGLTALDVEILASGGTARAIRDLGLGVRDVANYTGFPEMMEGRIKTLHPKVHGGILARRGVDDQAMRKHGIEPIDLVVVNLYPFESVIKNPGATRGEAIENIDIGGPCLIRSAAKNQAFVTVVVDPADYSRVLKQIQAGGVSQELRSLLAAKAFARTSRYDQAITEYLSGSPSTGPSLEPAKTLRYGENPHQSAELYRDLRVVQEGSLVAAKKIQGKALSYNNIMDADAALACVRQFETAACVIVKHANPCAVACAEDPFQAWRKAFDSDPVSAFGGIVAFNRPIDGATMEAIIDEQFVEVLIAPQVSQEVRESARRSKNLRLLEVGLGEPRLRGREYRRVSGGMLVQDADTLLLEEDKLESVGARAPTKGEQRDLIFAFQVVASVKSNAVVLARDLRTIGIGGGQPNRVTSARIAGLRASEIGLETQGTVLASDAFLPFRDTVDLAAEMGVMAIIQPGGSRRDDESIEAANEHGMAMVFTGYRHFKH